MEETRNGSTANTWNPEIARPDEEDERGLKNAEGRILPSVWNNLELNAEEGSKPHLLR
jgi:hypothetical protein